MSGALPRLLELPDSSRERVVVCKLGRLRYEPTWELQREIQASLVAAKRASPSEYLPHVLLLLEHNPVFTLGKGGDEHNLVWDQQQRGAAGVELHHVDRGGDVTFHGPGQLVGYPILDLDRFFTDIHRYLRELEETVILTLERLGLTAGRFEGRTGVWLGPDAQGPERKICAMGVRCSRWVTMHGFALNVDPSLSFYDGIIPCGIGDRGITSVDKERGLESPRVTVPETMELVVGSFSQTFGCDTVSLEGGEAWEFLSRFIKRKLKSASFLA